MKGIGVGETPGGERILRTHLPTIRVSWDIVDASGKEVRYHHEKRGARVNRSDSSFMTGYENLGGY